MSINFRVKWLLYILNQNREKGLSIFPIIFIILIILAVSGIFTWSWFQSEINYQQEEARYELHHINESQQDYFSTNGSFATGTIVDKGEILGFKTQPTNYKYLISPIGKEGVNIFAIPLRRELKGYTGVVGFVRPNRLQAIICETKKAGDTPISGEVTITEVNCPRNSSLASAIRNLCLGNFWE
ncbi:MAG TPA: type IV pilin-like G/H family protein, partial [Phormidium sp.]